MSKNHVIISQGFHTLLGAFARLKATKIRVLHEWKWEKSEK
jgi:hypothetical protein